MNESISVIDASLYDFVLKVQEHVQFGWEIDPDSPPKMWGTAYETGLIRTKETTAAMMARQSGGKPKMSKEESLQIAREARAAKRVQGDSNED